MGSRAQQITVPARFISMTAHFIAVLTVLYDLDEISRRGGGPSSSAYNEISSLTYIAIVFFCLEYLALFAGVSLFFPGANAMHTMLHFFGTIFVGIFATQTSWKISLFGWFFGLFNVIPVAIETYVAYGVFRLRFLEFR